VDSAFNTWEGESEFVRRARARIVVHYIRVKVLFFYTAVKLKVEGSVSFLDGVKNCTGLFLLCYEFVQFLTPSKKLTDPSTFI
jgi:hypothetical protein